MTLDQTIHMNEEEFQQSKILPFVNFWHSSSKTENKIIDNLKLNIHDLKSKINLLENDKYNIARQKDQTIEILNKEINKGVNINYLKNIFLSFITTNDESVLNVI